MRGMINKGRALVITVWLMSLVRTNADPKLWQVCLIGILMYEGILLFIRTWQQVTRKRVKHQNIVAGREDMKRVKNALIGWPMKEVG